MHAGFGHLCFLTNNMQSWHQSISAQVHRQLALIPDLKVHYATFYRPINKQSDRTLDARNSLQECLDVL